MREHVQNQGRQNGETEAECVAAEAARASTESNPHSFTPSESALQGEVGRLTRRVKELGEQIARLRQKWDFEVEHVLSERGGLQICLDSTALQLGGVLNVLKTARERLEYHRACSTASPLRLEWLLVPLVSGFIERCFTWCVRKWLLIVQAI